MQNSKYLCLVFALIALKAFCDPVWVDSAFSISPALLVTTEIQTPPMLTIQLLNGPKNSTNLLALGYKYKNNQTSEISLLNTTTLSIIRDFFDIGSLYSLENVAMVSTPDSIVYTVVAKDDKGISQISVFTLEPEAYFPEVFQITNSTDKHMSFQVMQLLAHGENPVAVLLETDGSNMTLSVALINITEKKIGKKFSIVSGSIENVTCDISFSSASVVCLYKINQTVYRVYVSFKDHDSSPEIDQLFTDDNTTSSKKVTHIPQKVSTAHEYFIYFIANQFANHTELVALKYNKSADTNYDASTMTLLKNLSISDSYPLKGVVPSNEGFVVFHRMINETKNQSWFYTIYNKDFTINGTEVKFADVSGTEAEFEVAQEFGSGAVNIAAYNFTTWEGATVFNLYYGQILPKTQFNSG